MTPQSQEIIGKKKKTGSSQKNVVVCCYYLSLFTSATLERPPVKTEQKPFQTEVIYTSTYGWLFIRNQLENKYSRRLASKTRTVLLSVRMLVQHTYVPEFTGYIYHVSPLA